MNLPPGCIHLFTVPAGTALEQTDNGDFIAFLPDGTAKLFRVTISGGNVETTETITPPLKLERR